jgi:methylthioribose-1-phosphate isomerase
VSTIDSETADGASIIIEDRGEEEVLSYASARSAPQDARALNPAFDVTPARLITAIVTERAVLRPRYEDAIASITQPAAVAR